MPITVDCSCGRQIKARDQDAGKTANCPSCARPIAIPGTRVAPVSKPPHRMDGGRVLQMFGLAAISFWCAGSMLLSYASKSNGAFDESFAVGATANAAQQVARVFPIGAAACWTIAFLLCWLIMAVNRLRWTIQDRA